MGAPRSRSIALLALLLIAACQRAPLRGSEGAPIVDAGAGAETGQPDFVVAAPCEDEGDYATGATTIVFGFLGMPGSLSYDPRCLRVDAGTTVTFAGDFAAHPLYPSRARGTIQGNPIPAVGNGHAQDIRFAAPGTFAYYCGVHGAFDDGQAMAGVVWVK